MRWFGLMLMSLVLTVLLGCNTTVTETGYEPRKLGMGDAQLKGLYAPKYSPEAARAASERESESKTKAPGLFR